jgi:uncharacterized membrane protein
MYALSALYLKQATMAGGGLWRITFLTTWGQALLFLPLLFTGNGSLLETHWGQVFLTALLFYVGQLCVFAGMRFGDVSVVTPVMGVKVLLVAARGLLGAPASLKTPPTIQREVSFPAKGWVGRAPFRLDGSMRP